MNKNRTLILLLLLAALASIALTRASSRDRPVVKEGKEVAAAQIETPSQNGVDETAVSPDEDVRRRSLLGPLQAPFDTLGDRLEKRGKERITLSGTLTRSDEAQATAFSLVWERPGRLRLDEQGSTRRVTTFDGQAVTRSDSAQTFDDNLLETLLYDTAEHFFVSQMQGAATRSLGSRFRLIEDSEGPYSGPFYDIFEVTEQISIDGEAREQTRQYFFNSDTHLLDFVKYQIFGRSEETRVEVRLENWQRINGQQFPGRIVRLENNTSVLTLNLTSASVSAKAEDGLFTQ